MLGISMVFVACYVFMLVAFFISACKTVGRERAQLLVLGAVMTVGSAVLIVSGLTENGRLLITGMVSPIGLFFVITSAFSLYSCRRCSYRLTAKCTGFRLTGTYFTDYYPRFKYYYNEKNYESYSLTAYKKREAKRLYQTGTEYTVYIDPDQPGNCVCDVKRSCARHIFTIVVGAVVFLVGAAALAL